MKQISLNEYLDDNNPWVDRLLGNEKFQKKRDATQIELEYDQTFYGKRLDGYREYLTKTKREIIYGPKGDTLACVGDNIFIMPQAVYVSLKRSAFLDLLDRFQVSGELCELGAGNGQNILWLKELQARPVYGGEYSKNAVKLAEILGLEISPFNFYARENYNLIRPDTTVFTFHAIEQIPDATCVIEGLKAQKNRIHRIINFEPLYDHSRKDILGSLRNRYKEINDYNRNLFQCLENDPEIVIEYLERDFLGNNPLNPASILVWKFI